MHEPAMVEAESEEEHVTAPLEAKQKKTKASTTKYKTKKPNIEEKATTSSDGEASDITITKEVQPSGSREMKQMAQVAKRKGNLSSANT